MTEGLSIFRAEDAPGLMEAGRTTVEPFSAARRAGMDRALAAGAPFRERAAGTCAQHRGAWKAAERPSVKA